MKTRITKLAALGAAALLLLTAAEARGEEYRFRSQSVRYFKSLITDLQQENKKVTEKNREDIAKDLAAIEAASADDYAIALEIMDCWDHIAMNPDYPMWIYGGGEYADELADAGIENSPAHAFVVMGYELYAGKMRDELKGRCDAAAAAARSYPDTIVICTGGETGASNPHHRTEAGVMKEYLTGQCGIDPERVFTDEEALITLDNAVNVFRILKAQGIRSVTIVTSAYHQRWSRMMFQAVAALYRQAEGYGVEFAANYNFIGEKGLTAEQERASALSQLSRLFTRYGEKK